MPVELGGKQRELYEAIRVAAHADVRKAIRAKGLAASAITILDALTKLRQVCCDPRLVAMDAARTWRDSAKLEALLRAAPRSARGRATGFSCSRSSRACSRSSPRRSAHAASRYLMLTGQTRDRQRVVDAFEEGRGRRLPHQPQGRRHGPEPHERRHRRALRPVVESRGPGAGDRPCVPHRPDASRCSCTTSSSQAASRSACSLCRSKKRWLSSAVLGDEGGAAVGEHGDRRAVRAARGIAPRGGARESAQAGNGWRYGRASSSTRATEARSFSRAR